jgi:hypothetical protein
MRIARFGADEHETADKTKSKAAVIAAYTVYVFFILPSP